jgi:hypothetical protein
MREVGRKISGFRGGGGECENCSGLRFAVWCHGFWQLGSVVIEGLLTSWYELTVSAPKTEEAGRSNSH